MVVRVAERAAATIADDVTVAVDDQRVQRAVTAAGFNAVLTDVEHTSGPIGYGSRAHKPLA